MIKSIEFPNISFSNKDDLFHELKKNEFELIGIKKSQVYKSCEKGQLSVLNAEKIFKNEKSIQTQEGHIYPVISTTNYMDSHKDVHFDGCFTKTVKEQQGKVYYALDHELKYNSILAWQKHVKMTHQKIDWGIVGKNYNGQTEGLIFDINKDNIRNKEVLKDIEELNSDFENSIRMIYYKIFLGINSELKDFKENKEYFDKKIELISNKDDVFENGYFWGVEELGIYKEGSLVVAGGSNDATSIYQHKEAVIDTSKNEPPTGTQTEQQKVFINSNLI